MKRQKIKEKNKFSDGEFVMVGTHTHVYYTVDHAIRNFVSMVKVNILIMDLLFGWI